MVKSVYFPGEFSEKEWNIMIDSWTSLMIEIVPHLGGKSWLRSSTRIQDVLASFLQSGSMWRRTDLHRFLLFMLLTKHIIKNKFLSTT